jgi:hypothetical protein
MIKRFILKKGIKPFFFQPDLQVCGRVFNCSYWQTIVAVLLGLVAESLHSSGSVNFQGEFAPSETWVKAPEKTFRDDISLDGSWQFQSVALPPGFRQGTDPAPELPPPSADGWEKTPLKVPSPWNANSFANAQGLGGDFRCYPSYPSAWERVKMGWIRRSFDVPADWRGRRVLLHVGAAAGDLHFEINGRGAGSRFDIFFPFDIDVTDLVQYGGTNELLVGVRKPELFDVAGKYGRRNYQAGSFWGQHVVGIWQDIDLVAVPVVRVSDVFVQSLLDQDTLKAEVTVHNDSPVDVSVNVAGRAMPWISRAAKDAGWDPAWKLGDEAALTLPAAATTVPAHSEKTVTLEGKVGSSLQLWTLDQPNLYGLLVDVDVAGQPVDRKYTRFGWRQFTLQGPKILLNGQPVVLKGDSWHFLGIPQMTRRYPWAWFTALHDAHLNAVRLHAEPYPEFYLDVADEMGIMVLDETAIWASDGGPKLDSDAFWKDTESHIRQLVTRDRTHPSVFGWSVCNEVKPVVQNVFHNPPGMYDKLLSYYPIWAGIVHDLDPTRQWISADGDEDAGGELPIYMIHYGSAETMQRAVATGKPWGVGEAGGAYYATPQQVAKNFGEHAYESFEGRMEGIALEAYQHLLLQRKYNGDYRSVFNLVWYGLQPLPLGLADTTKPPTLNDGIFFPPLVEGQPGVQPERLGPYCTTLNPGYDPSLPLYKPWPLFEAIQAASAEPPADFQVDSTPAVAAESGPVPVKSIDLLAGLGGGLREKLASMGVPFDTLKASGTPELLFIDGAHPPDASVGRPEIDAVLAGGGTVVVWGASRDTLPQLNALLPAPLELTDRQSSSLLPGAPDPVTAGLKPSMMYFSELSPPTILNGGLGGPLVTQGTVLLQACDADWLRWNGKPEYAKTAMIVRSEREAKPSGAALVEVKQGGGRLLVCNLPAASGMMKAQTLIRALLTNLGLQLNDATEVSEAFLDTGELVGALGAGRYSVSGGGQDEAFVDPAAEDIRAGLEVAGKKWGLVSAENNALNLQQDPPFAGPGNQAVVYLSLWVLSPRSLDDLLLEPNVPKVDFQVETSDALDLWLNGKSVLKSAGGGEPAKAQGLPLQRGWNHFLFRLIHDRGEDKLRAKLISSQPGFLGELKSAVQKP